MHVDADRLLGRISDLAEIGAIEGGGCARLALTDEDRAGRDLVVSWMEDLDLDIRIDAIGNVVGQRAGLDASLTPVMCGSHIDTVRTGGRFDGNYGVLAGLEVIETLAREGRETRRPIAVAFFTDEEGARFAPDMLGSLVYVGGLSIEAALDTIAVDGARLGTELKRIGYAGLHPCPGLVPHAFVELHIEQGPVLEAEGITIGAVERVQGISWQEITVRGQSNHAGTTPMHMRRDAGYAAARIATAVRELAQEIGGDQVGTVGSLSVFPNLVNVVAQTATLTVDLRNTDDDLLSTAEARLAATLTDLATEEGVEIATRSLARFAPVDFDERIVALVEQTARQLGYSVRRMPSGAGHDAQMLARACPAGMIFVPSIAGVSHNPAESTSPADLAAGAAVLLEVLCTLADEEDV